MRDLLLIAGLATTWLSCKQKSDAQGDESCTAAQVADLEWTGESLIHDGPCGWTELVPRVIGQGEWTIDFEANKEGAMVPTLQATSDSIFHGLVLEGRWSTVNQHNPVFWRQGYQSWSWSGVTEALPPERDDHNVMVPGGDGDGRTVFEENGFTSWWVGLVGTSDGSSLLFGLQGATITRFFMGVDGETVQLVWGHRGERIERKAGETLALDPVWVGAGTDAHGLHTEYAQATADRISMPALDRLPPTGWATWYQYYADVTEADVRTNLTALTELSAAGSEPLDVFQIDDGWQVRWGDWWAGPAFPSGMEAIAEDIANAGMVPGIWLAPFYMSTESETYRQHPEWWVKNDDGEPIVFTNLGTGEYVIVDATHPEAADWLGELIRRVVAQGYNYLKLDFLYAGAMEGVRFEDITGTAAYHRGMEVIREAAGDAWILACGAPFLPSVGYAESFRTGSDIAFESWTEPHIDFYRWQARATSARAWTHSIWWWIDPDQLIVREPLSALEVSGALASAVVAAGTWMLGDELTVLPVDRLNSALNPALLSLRGQPVRPVDPLSAVSGVDPGPIVEMTQDDDVTPSQWIFNDGTTVLLNLSPTPLDVFSPGGTELISGVEGPAEMRTLLPGTGEVWQAPRD